MYMYISTYAIVHVYVHVPSIMQVHIPKSKSTVEVAAHFIVCDSSFLLSLLSSLIVVRYVHGIIHVL